MHSNSHTPSNTAETVAAKANQVASNASNEFQNFIADVEDLVKETTTLTGEDLARAKAKLSARLADAKDSVMAVGGDIAKSARKGATVTNEYVHEQPWIAIGAGAALGLIIGFALARR